jgi:hypothetical protein
MKRLAGIQRLIWGLALLSGLGAGGALAAEVRTVTVEGMAVLANTTSEQAQKLALDRARQNAIETVCGVSVQSETYVQNNMLEGDFIHSVSYGHIIAEEILGWDTETTRTSSTQPPQVTYRVTLKATVRKETGRPDPYYQVNCRLNQKIYRSGEEMIITVKATQPSYISVLNIAADGSVVLLFPNRLRRDNYVKPLEEFQIPSQQDRRDVLKLQVATLPGHKKDTEYIKVIATRKPLHLLDGLAVQGQYGMLRNVRIAATEIARLISAIPPKDRAEHTVFYEVVSAD